MKKDKMKCIIKLVKKRFKDLLNKKDSYGEPIFLWIVIVLSTIGMLLITFLMFEFRYIPIEVGDTILFIGGGIAFIDTIALILLLRIKE